MARSLFSKDFGLSEADIYFLTANVALDGVANCLLCGDFSYNNFRILILSFTNL